MITNLTYVWSLLYGTPHFPIFRISWYILLASLHIINFTRTLPWYGAQVWCVMVFVLSLYNVYPGYAR